MNIEGNSAGAWAAACYLASDPSFEGTQHGVRDRGTLCGLPEDAVVIVRNPFFGTGLGTAVGAQAASQSQRAD